MLEVWGVLEVVREQCWLNEVLNGVKWGVVEEENKMESEDQATEEELLALLAGLSYLSSQSFPLTQDGTGRYLRTA